MSIFLKAFLLYLFADIYSFFGLRNLFAPGSPRWLYIGTYLLTGLFVWYCFYMIYDIASNRSMFSGTEVNFYLGLFLTALAAKVAFSFFMIFQDGPRIFMGFINFLKSFGGDVAINDNGGFMPSRRKAFTLVASGLATIPFLTMLYGVTKGKYRYTVEKLKLAFTNLPTSFEGYKIVQISDIHAGSFDSKEDVMKGVEMINTLDADLVLFTGDLVNSNKDEIDPYIDVFNKIKAKDGCFAVLGNHDYYGVHRLEDGAEPAYWNDFFDKFKRLGFDLLNNENRQITRNGEVLNIIGVENWGKSRYFPKKADLNKALAGVPDNEFCVLLSHDPTHWEEKVISHNRHIDLTLSGHTHGFQFGFSLPNFHWSPAQYRYKRWMGLHEAKNQKLYINKGYGFLAFPGRVGMWPEITLIELGTA